MENPMPSQIPIPKPAPGDPVFVIAVSGISGVGKTSLIERMADRLGNAARLHFDHYVVLGNDIGDIAAWLEAGVDPNVVETPQFAADLERLRRRQSVRLPQEHGVVEPADFVILEEPFGRSRDVMAPMIDLAVHIAIPHDVAMARRLLRTVGLRPQMGDPGLIDELEEQLRAFLAGGRDIYLALDIQAQAGADLVLDGLRPVEALADDLMAAIAARL
jgi:uridine kinase